MNKLAAFWNLFKQGQAIADAQKWKLHQISATMLAGFLLAVVNIAAVFGYAMPIDVEAANAIAAGIIAVVNVVLTVITTEKVGITNLTEKPMEQPKQATNTANEEPSLLDTNSPA